jgi:cell division protein FtsB
VLETRYSLTERVKQPSPDVPDARSARPPRRRGRRALHYLLLFIGFVLVIDALVGEKGLLAMIKAREQHRGIEQALAEARAENARLREEARRLREDPASIEEIARRELGLIKPGEKLFIIRDVARPQSGARGR